MAANLNKSDAGTQHRRAIIPSLPLIGYPLTFPVAFCSCQEDAVLSGASDIIDVTGN